MSTEYEKELEVRNELLASLLSKRNPGETVFMVDIKPDHVFSCNNVGTLSLKRIFYASLNEAFIAYASDQWADKFTPGCGDEFANKSKEHIDIYEYNIISGVKTKVFG